jgi:hypothetical protein
MLYSACAPPSPLRVSAPVGVTIINAKGRLSAGDAVSAGALVFACRPRPRGVGVAAL